MGLLPAAAKVTVRFFEQERSVAREGLGPSSRWRRASVMFAFCHRRTFAEKIVREFGALSQSQERKTVLGICLSPAGYAAGAGVT